MDKKITYTKAMKELEEILSKIENEETDLDLLSEKIKRASFLIKICKDKLRETETDVEDVLKQIEKNEEV